MRPAARSRARLPVALLVAAASVAGTAPAAGAETGVAMGEPFVVNEVVDWDQREPEVASLPDGGFVAVWKAQQIGGVFGRIFGGDGRPASPEFPVVEETQGFARPEPRGPLALAAGPSGRFGIVWSESERTLHGHLFETDSRPSGPGFEVASEGLEAEGIRSSSATLSPDGRLWVAWSEASFQGTRILVRSFERDGEPRGEPVVLAAGVRVLSRSVTLSAGGDGAILAAWTEGGEGFAIRGRLHRPGTGWGEPFTVAGQLGDDPFFLEASAGSLEGGFAVVWLEGESVFLQVLDPGGGRRGPRRKVPRTLVPASFPAVARDGAGNVVVVWMHERAVRARCFGPDGTPLSDDLLISPDPRVPDTAPAVAGLPAGGFVVVWEAAFGDGWDSAIMGRFLAPPTPGIVGLTSARYVAREGDGQAEVSVARTQGSLGPATVRFRVRGETAVAGQDFEPVGGELSWGDGEADPRIFSVPVADDGRREGEEEAVVELFSPGGGAILGRAEARLVLRDDDGLARPGAASRQLSAADVECDRQRLVGLVQRMDGFDRGLNLALTATGDPFGVLYYHDFEEGVDAVLSFSANAEETPFLRNPARPQLPTVSLTRNELATDLIQDATPPGQGRHRQWLQVTLDPTLEGGAGPALLAIDNALEPDGFLRAGRSTDTKPGRGLLPLLRPCHGKLTPQDVHVLRLLARTLRAAPGRGQDFMRTVLYRSEEPGHYVIETFAFRSTLELDLFVTFDADGSPLEGTLRVRERCPPLRSRGCSTVDDFVVTVGLPPPLDDPAAIDPRYRVVVGNNVPVERTEVTFDWLELLAGTTWRNPL